jgi:STE24 endopeptidase
MSVLSQAFIAIVIAVSVFRLYLTKRQISSIKAHFNQVPQWFASQISLDEHQKAGNYNLAKLNLSVVENIFSTIVLLVFTIGGGIQFINDQYVSLADYPLTYGVVVIGVFSLINAIISLPFGIYGTFGIEQRFGFNKTTVKLFIVDLVKSFALSLVIGIPFLYLVLWLMGVMGQYWWLWVWGVFVAFNLLMLIIYPTFIAPLFNKFSPLTDEELKTKIDNLLRKCGFKSSGVFVMDGSKRSSHGNAYFTGFGKTKRIVFFDTLIKQLTPNEIEAVLAHELGHFKLKHIVKQIILSFSIALFTLYILSLLIDTVSFYNALGVTAVTNYNGLLLFMLVIGVVSFPLAPIMSYFSRKNEFEADDFAKHYTDKNELINGLVKMYRDNASTLTPDELYVKFYYSHPPATVRIANLEKD